MEFKQLEAFVAAVDYNSFSEAAKHLCLKQPTISAHINNLEKELNAKLIVRTTKKMELTYRGQQLYQYALHILNVRNSLVSEFAEEDRKVISMGVSTIPSTYILPEVMKNYKKRHADVEFHIWQSDSKTVIDKVIDGTLDVGLTSMDTNAESCVCIPFFQDELVIAAPNNPHFQKLKEEQADLVTLLKEPFIMREKGSGTRKEIEDFLRRHQISEKKLRVVACMNDLESIKHAILNELGISILSALSIWELTTAGKMIEFPLGNAGHQRNFFIVYNKNRILKQYVKELIYFMGEFYGAQMEMDWL